MILKFCHSPGHDFDSLFRLGTGHGMEKNRKKLQFFKLKEFSLTIFDFF